MLRLLARRHRMLFIAWPAGLLTLLAITVPSYHATYGDDLSAAPALEQMRTNTALQLLYGHFPDPPSLGGMTIWETGTYMLLLGAVMAIFAAATMTRGAEDAGLIELVRSCGIRPGAPLHAALALLTALCLGVGAGIAAILAAQAQLYSGLAAGGGILFGAIVGLASLAMGLLTLVAAQLRGTHAGARGTGLLALAAVYLVRVAADQWHQDALLWFSPLGWRDLAAPYAGDHWWVLAPLAAVCAALAAIALRLGHRDLGAAWIPESRGSTRGLAVRGPVTWALREARTPLIAWSITIALLAALFGSMSRSMVDALTSDPQLAQMMAQMGLDPTDAVATYYSFLGATLSLLVMIATVALARRWRTDERTGWMVHELATGTRRPTSLAARIAVATSFGVAASLATGAILGAYGASQLGQDRLFAFGITAGLGQLPAILAALGIAVAWVALAPRSSSSIWAIVTASGLLFFFGDLLRLPAGLIDLGLLAHGPVAQSSGWPDWGAWLVGAPGILLALGIGGIAVALAAVGRRDLTSA